jgi:hypothetical protein
MSKFTYILSYNPVAPNPSVNQIHAFIVSNRNVDVWYYAFSGTYVFKSPIALITLAPSFRQFFDGTPFILTYAVPSLISGLLPQTVWDWINAAETPALSGNI